MLSKENPEYMRDIQFGRIVIKVAYWNEDGSFTSEANRDNGYKSRNEYWKPATKSGYEPYLKSKQMTNLSINGIELLAVEVPDKFIFQRFLKDRIHYSVKGQFSLVERYIYLPSGEYEPLGLIKDISEQVAATIVERQFDTFMDYEDPSVGGYILGTAKESLSSLIKSKGLDSDFTYLLKLKK